MNVHSTRCGPSARADPIAVASNAFSLSIMLRIARIPRHAGLIARARSLHESPSTTYARLVELGRIRADESQQHAMQHLQTLFEACGNVSKTSIATASDDDHMPSARSSPAGVYLFGSVGSGKTMLMDLFVGACGSSAQRLHFHELMLEVHSELHRLHVSRPRTVVQSKFGLPMFKYGDMSEERPVPDAPCDETLSSSSSSSSSSNGAGDGEPPPTPPPPPPTPLERVIERVASRGPVLCLDEMQVTDVADAMLLRQLFEGLFARGVRVVFTSNRPPEELYERGEESHKPDPPTRFPVSAPHRIPSHIIRCLRGAAAPTMTRSFADGAFARTLPS